MTTQKKEHQSVSQFYQILDETVADSFSDEQKKAIEQAIISSGLHHRHALDVRKSLPWFGKRYYLVLLMGRDRRHQLRNPESKIANFLMTLLILIGGFTVLGLALLALYLIKSALGIDLFEDFSLGIWDWFKGLMQ